MDQPPAHWQSPDLTGYGGLGGGTCSLGKSDPTIRLVKGAYTEMSDFIRAALIGRALNRASCCIIVTSLISCNVCPSCYSGGKSKASKFALTRTAGGTNGSGNWCRHL